MLFRVLFFVLIHSFLIIMELLRRPPVVIKIATMHHSKQRILLFIPFQVPLHRSDPLQRQIVHVILASEVSGPQLSCAAASADLYRGNHTAFAHQCHISGMRPFGRKLCRLLYHRRISRQRTHLHSIAQHSECHIKSTSSDSLSPNTCPAMLSRSLVGSATCSAENTFLASWTSSENTAGHTHRARNNPGNIMLKC